MENTLDIKKFFLSHFADFEHSLNGGKSNSIHQLRKAAISNFSNLLFPTVKDEEWKYTNISPLLKHTFVPSQMPPADYVPALESSAHDLGLSLSGRDLRPDLYPVDRQEAA